jgi:hypothetical protein
MTTRARANTEAGAAAAASAGPAASKAEPMLLYLVKQAEMAIRSHTWTTCSGPSG